MLTVLVGSNTTRRNTRLETLFAPLKKNGAEVIFYNDVTFSADALRASPESSSLFGIPAVSVISGVGDSAALRDELEKILPKLAESAQHFFLSEHALPADFKKRAVKAGATLEEFEEKNKIKKEEAFNFFLFTDAFSARKRTQTWALYRHAIQLGLEPRELHGKIFWCVKNMLLAEKTTSPTEAGMHPFVYEKSKASAKNFAQGELSRIATELTSLFHDSMLEGFDFEATLESFILRTLNKI